MILLNSCDGRHSYSVEFRDVNTGTMEGQGKQWTCEVQTLKIVVKISIKISPSSANRNQSTKTTNQSADINKQFSQS